MVWASALHAGDRGFESRASTFPDFFYIEVFVVRESIMLSKFNCNTLGLKTVPFIFIIQLAFVSSNRSPGHVYMFLYRMHGPISYLIIIQQPK